MDEAELQDVLLKVLTLYGPDLAGMANSASGSQEGGGLGGAGNISQLLGKLK